MSQHEPRNSQPLRELEWLFHYFQQHAREDLAQEIFEQIKVLRRRAQGSLTEEAADIRNFKETRRMKTDSE